AQFLLDSESSRSAEFARMDGADSGADRPASHNMNGHDMSSHDTSGHAMSGHAMSGHDMSDHSMPAGATAGETSTLSDPAMHDPEDHDAATHYMAGHDGHGKASMDRPHDHGAEYDGDSAAAQEPDEKSGTAGTQQDGHRHD
ncbi:MAG: hypothetical protein V2I24_10775, partial [Halieaceae bacterium]|nr:hypothetical protein [Halieaceae bacterium]